jgi:hypothetical protein
MIISVSPLITQVGSTASLLFVEQDWKRRRRTNRLIKYFIDADFITKSKTGFFEVYLSAINKLFVKTMASPPVYRIHSASDPLFFFIGTNFP